MVEKSLNKESTQVAAPLTIPSPAERFRRRSLHDQLVDEIGSRIVRGEFDASGSLPTEPELIAELGVSRNALREAIKVLVGKGLLEVRPKTGMRVRARTEWNLLDRSVLDWHASSGSRLTHAFDLVEFRLIIEPKASFLAAKRATQEECDAILRACEDLEACVENPTRIADVDLTFHGLIHHATHNALLIHLGRLIRSSMYIQVQITAGDLASFKKGLPVHRSLAEAIARREPTEAEAISATLVRMPYEELAEQTGVSGPHSL